MFRSRNGISAGIGYHRRQSWRNFTVAAHACREWYPSKVVSDRKSEFQARHVPLSCQDEIPGILEEFLSEHKQIAKSASHPHMYAWRTGKESPVSEPLKLTGRRKRKNKDAPEPVERVYTNVEQGFYDNGEATAGAKILEKVILKYDLYNILIIATRWMSGNHIGSARFKHIVSTSVDSLRHDPSLNSNNSRF